MGVYSLVNIALVAVGVAFPGWVGLWAIFVTSFFMSVMFPTIFALGIDGLDRNTKIGGSLIVMAIVGRRRAHAAHGLDFTDAAQHREGLHGPALLLLRYRSLLLCWSAHEAQRGKLT